MRRFATMLIAAACAVVADQSAGAQAKAGAFGMGYTDVGPVVGLGNLGSASASFGGRFEHAIKPLPDLANGMLGIQVSFDYYSWSNNAFSVKYIPLGATVNYHFKLDEPKIDPFVGLGLGYNVTSCSYAGSSSIGCANSAIYFIGRVGARYFFAPNMAVYGDLGAGAATLNLGLMFKLQ